MDAGKWTHIVYAVDKDGGIKLYKTGELLKTAAIPADKQSASADSGLPFLIGGGNNWHVGANNFALDDVRIYRRALGDKEAQALAYREKAENAGQISFAASAQTIDELRGFVAELQSDLSRTLPASPGRPASRTSPWCRPMRPIRRPPPSTV